MVAAAGSFKATISAGVSVFGGASTLSAGSAFAAAAIGGAAGSIASQAVGMATVNVQSFSWRGVATGALTAGAGAGLGALAQAGAFDGAIQGGAGPTMFRRLITFWRATDATAE